MTAHPHAENMRLYAEDAAETDKPWERWEFRWKDGQNDKKWSSFSLNPSWLDDAEYRRKPKPLECWAVANGDGSLYATTVSHHCAVTLASGGKRVVRMREVTE